MTYRDILLKNRSAFVAERDKALAKANQATGAIGAIDILLTHLNEAEGVEKRPSNGHDAEAQPNG